MISYYKQLTLLKGLGEILGHKVKVRSEGFDMLWIKDDKTYSFNLGYEGNEGQMVVEAVANNFEHIQVIMNDKNEVQVKGLSHILKNVIDIRAEFSLKELIRVVMPEDRMIKRSIIASRIYKLTGKKFVEHILQKAVKEGLIEKHKLGLKASFYKRVDVK